MCDECGRRPVKCRRRCHACYQRHRAHGTTADLPRTRPPAPRDHTDDGCRVCDEVAHLHSNGVTAHIIVENLGMTADAVHKHLCTYTPHLAVAVKAAATTARMERKRKKGTLWT